MLRNLGIQENLNLLFKFLLAQSSPGRAFRQISQQVLTDNSHNFSFGRKKQIESTTFVHLIGQLSSADT